MADVTESREGDGRRTSPVVARRHLVRRFVKARHDAGFSSRDQAAKALGWSTRKQVLLESGEQAVLLRDLDTIFIAFQVPDAEQAAWASLAEAARTKGWWDAYEDADMGPAAKDFAGLEWGARRVRAFTGSIMPALLQIPGYATAALRGTGVTPQPPEQIRRLLDVRRQRQRLLGPPDPLEYHVILDEAALSRPAGDAATMRAQLLHVVDQAEARPNVTVQVVPYAVGVYPGQSGNFTLLDFDGHDDDPGIVHLEPGFAVPLILDDRADVYLHSRVFERLIALALSPEESLHLLHTAAISAKGPAHE